MHGVVEGDSLYVHRPMFSPVTLVSSYLTIASPVSIVFPKDELNGNLIIDGYYVMSA